MANLQRIEKAFTAWWLDCLVVEPLSKFAVQISITTSCWGGWSSLTHETTNNSISTESKNNYGFWFKEGQSFQCKAFQFKVGQGPSLKHCKNTYFLNIWKCQSYCRKVTITIFIKQNWLQKPNLIILILAILLRLAKYGANTQQNKLICS